MKRVFAVLLAVMTFAMGGCLDARSLDEYGYVLGIGVDAGEATLYRISFMVQKEGPSADTAATGFEVMTAEADTLSEAVMISETGLPYELNLSRASLLMVSQEAAQTNLLERFLEADLSAEKIRPDLDILVVYGRTDDFMAGLQNDADPNAAKMQATMLELSRDAGSLPSANLALFMEGIRGGRFDPILPLGVMDENIDLPMKDGQPQQPEAPAPELSVDMTGCLHGHDSALAATTERKGGLRSAFAGSAVFDGCRMVGFLSTLHTEVLLMARGEYHTGILKLTDGEGRLMSLRLTADREPKTELALTDPPRVRITVPLTCRLEMEDSLAVGLPPIGKDALERCAEEFLEREISRVFAACRERGADAFGFGRLASMRFATVSAWEGYAWQAQYPRLEAEFCFRVELDDRERVSKPE